MSDSATSRTPDTPTHRYDASLAASIEQRWQDRWEEEGTFEAPNPSGPLAEPDKVAGREKLFVLDMFPYPSGKGLQATFIDSLSIFATAIGLNAFGEFIS